MNSIIDHEREKLDTIEMVCIRCCKEVEGTCKILLEQPAERDLPGAIY